MSEDKRLIKLYSASGEGRIDAGFNAEASQLLQVVSGNARITIGTEVVDASMGDFLFIPSNLVFLVDSIDGFAAVRGFVFDRTLVEMDMDKFDGEINYMFYVQSFSRVVSFTKEHPIYDKIAYCMSEAYEEYISKDVCYGLPVKAYLNLLVAEILRYYAGQRNEMDRMVYHNVIRLRPVIEYISEHYAEKIYIETLADIIGVSPDYFTKMFKDSIGTTPIDYINGVKVNHSLRLLTMTDTPVNEIAEKVGFSGPNYFHKIFKSYMVTSPLAYRKAAEAKGSF